MWWLEYFSQAGKPEEPGGSNDNNRVHLLKVQYIRRKSVAVVGQQFLLFLSKARLSNRVLQSRNPERFFQHLTSRAYLQSRILPPFCIRIFNPEVQLKEIPDPEKAIGDPQKRVATLGEKNRITISENSTRAYCSRAIVGESTDNGHDVW